MKYYNDDMPTKEKIKRKKRGYLDSPTKRIKRDKKNSHIDKERVTEELHRYNEEINNLLDKMNL